MEAASPRTRIRRLPEGEFFWLLVLMAVTLACHLSVVGLPTHVVFDEMHYLPDARSILAGQGTLRPEHPPLAKLFIAAGIALFGDRPLGWRFFSIAFGTISILLFFLVCRRLGLSRRVALMATLLLAFENMTFVQASIAMLDVYSLTFMLAAFWAYLAEHYPLAGLFVALSALAKCVGFLAFGAILLHWLYIRRDKVVRLIVGLVIAPLAFMAFLPISDLLVVGRLTNPFSQIRTMLSLNATMTFAELTNTAMSRPWVWLLRHDTIPYSYRPDYMGAISYTVWALIIPVTVYMVYRAVKERDSAATFGVAWFLSAYLVWIPLVLLSDRVTYGFYFYPAIGAICMGLGMGLGQLVDVWNGRGAGRHKWIPVSIVFLYLLAHAVLFALVSPVSYWLGSPL